MATPPISQGGIRAAMTESPKIELPDRSFKTLIKSFGAIPLQHNGEDCIQLIEDIETQTHQEDAVVVSSAAEYDAVSRGDKEGLEKTNIEVEVKGFRRERVWFHHPLRNELIVAVTNTPEQAEITVEFVGPKAEVPEYLAFRKEAS